MLILCLSFAVAFFDQATKFLVLQNIPPGNHIPLIQGLFSLVHVRNTGAAWGMMQGFNTWLILLSIVMVGVIIGFRHRFMTDTVLYRIITGFMIGGIVGNLIDRMRLGYVVDFLSFYWQTHQFPSFNIADSAICTGVGLYLLAQVLGLGATRKEGDCIKQNIGGSTPPDTPR